MRAEADQGKGSFDHPGTAAADGGDGRSGIAVWFAVLSVAVGVGLVAGSVAAWPSGRAVAAAIAVAVLVELAAAGVLAVVRLLARTARRTSRPDGARANGAQADRTGDLGRRHLSVGAVVAVATAVAVVASMSALRSDEDVEVVGVPRDACDRPIARGAIEVMVVWDDEAELGAFCEVVGEYTRRGHGDVEVVSEGEDVGARLEHRLAPGGRRPPDVAILPQPSLVRAFAVQGKLRAIEDEVADRLPPAWNAFVTAREEDRGPPTVFGAFVKGAHKSLFWYRPVELGNDVGIEPETWTWDELAGWIERHLDAESDVPPLTLAAANKWLLTDWFENQLAGNDADIYSDLARGRQADGDDIDWEAVRQAWAEALTQMADLWRTSGLFAANPRATTWQEMATQLYQGEAEMMFGPSFLAGRVDEGEEGGFRLYPFGFPTLAGGRPLVVGGDMAVIPEQAPHIAGAEGFVRWLTGAPAMERWSEADPGYLTPNVHTPHRPREIRPPDNEDDVRVYLTYQLRHPEGDLHFDLSDDQLAAANQDDPHRNWELFAAFFDDVLTGRSSRRCATRTAVERLEAEYRAEEWPEPSC